jgi:hypothetical protein
VIEYPCAKHLRIHGVGVRVRWHHTEHGAPLYWIVVPHTVYTDVAIICNSVCGQDH